MTHLMYHVPNNEVEYHEYRCEDCSRHLRIHKSGHMEVLDRGENELEHAVTGMAYKGFEIGAVN